MRRTVLIFLIVLLSGCGGGSNHSANNAPTSQPTQPTQPSNPTQPAVTNPPAINPNGGTVPPSEQISLTDTDASAAIFFTTDGSTPTTSSQVYTAPIALQGSSVMVKAIAQASSMEPSAVVSAAFQVQQQAQSPFPTFVQSVDCGPNTTNVSCTGMVLNTTAGNCLVEFSYLPGTSSVSPVPGFSTDSQGDKFQTIGTEPPNNQFNPETVGVFGALNIIGGSTQFPVTPLAGTSIFILEYANCGGFDFGEPVVIEGQAANQGSQTIFNAPSADTGSANESVLSFIAIDGESLATVTGNQRIDVGGSTGILIQDISEATADAGSTSTPTGDSNPTFSILTAPMTGDEVTFARLALVPNSN